MRLKCGEPMTIETNQSVCEYGIDQSVCSAVDTWTYNPGSGKFLHTLIMVGGKVVAIRQGARID
ncbi:MAG: DUF2845 domain-containing protein [Methylococcaceae bacterium]|nr:DUF2845 domain-containing protein [Methylococcaceae bacterium]